MTLSRHYVSPSDKIKKFSEVPENIHQMITGLILSDGSLRMNGKHAMFTLQLKNIEFCQHVWKLFKKHNLVTNSCNIIKREDKRSKVTTEIAEFQSLTLPYFTELFNTWYTINNGKKVKIIPYNIHELLTPISIAYWLAGEGTFDKSKSHFLY
jgi:LAGLIDADG DNA endonuclease family